jgi:hypothetical protein
LYHPRKPYMKNRWYDIGLMLMLPRQKLWMRNPDREKSHAKKRVQHGVRTSSSDQEETPRDPCKSLSHHITALKHI